MRLGVLDWAVVAAYVCFAIWVGLRHARRASGSMDEFFLSGRRLPWWIAGTSMVATTFAADTPLVVTGWVREAGIWKNWLWWGIATSTMLGVFVFARLWRRGGVMTKAELVELRYGRRSGRLLRGFLGIMHAAVTNTIILCWVLLAFAKIADVLLGVDRILAVSIACVIAMAYSLTAGFWGVVLTDLAQFVMSMVGAILLAGIVWSQVGSLGDPTLQAEMGREVLSFVPTPGDGGPLDWAFWTTPIAVFAVNVGMSWWVSEGVDGATVEVQRIAASRDERQGTRALLWYAVTHYALRPWPWIVVALLSIVVLPDVQVTSPVDGHVVSADAHAVVVQPAHGPAVTVPTDAVGTTDDWRATPAAADLDVGATVAAGQVVARTDSESAYVTMMVRYLPTGLLGLVVASLLAAFMSTIDTHVNLAASFFTHDLYRRFLAPDRSEPHYVWIARAASVGVLAVAGALATAAHSIGELFTFFLAFLGGVGPVYLLRWLWWRVGAVSEIAAMATSALTTTLLAVLDIAWPLTPLTPDGVLLHEGRLIIVVVLATLAAAVAMVLTPAPRPDQLLDFYRRFSPPGAWGPVRALAEPDTREPVGPWRPLIGVLSGLALVWGGMLGVGHLLLGHQGPATLALGLSALGAIGVARVLRSERS